MFIDGLRCLQIDEEVKRHPDLMQPLFVQQADKKLTAGKRRHVKLCATIVLNIFKFGTIELTIKINYYYYRIYQTAFES